MSKFLQGRRIVRSRAAGGGYQIRNAAPTRRSGRRAIRGVVLLAGLLGGLAVLAASGVPAYAGTLPKSLDFYSGLDNLSGYPNWNQSLAAGWGTTYSAPAMVRFSNASGTGTEVAYEGPGNSLGFSYNIDGQKNWNPSTIPGPGTYSAPAIVRDSTGTYVTAEGPGHQLEFYSNVDPTNPTNTWQQQVIGLSGGTIFSAPSMVEDSGRIYIVAEGPNQSLMFYATDIVEDTSWLKQTVAKSDTTYSAPALVRFSNASGTGTEVTAEGPGNSLDFYYNIDGQFINGQMNWIPSVAAVGGTTYSAPAMVRFANSSGTGIEVAAEGPGNSLDFYHILDGQSGPFSWHPSTISGPGAYSAPAMVRSSIGTEVAYEGPGNQLEFSFNIDGNQAWNPSTIPGPGTYSAPAMVRFADSLGSGTEVAAQVG